MGLLAGLLDKAIDVYQKLPTKDTSGGQVPGFALVPSLTSLPASIQPKRGKAQIALGQRQVFLTHSVYMESDYGIKRGWKLVDPDTNQSFIVHGIEDMGGQGEAFRFECLLET